MIRSAKYTGETGDYNTVFNSTVRLLGMKSAKELRSAKKDYDEICSTVYDQAKKYWEYNGEDLLHPKGKVDAWYGMTEEQRKDLELEKKNPVYAYKTKWLNELLEEIYLLQHD